MIEDVKFLLRKWGDQQRRLANAGVYVTAERNGELVKLHFPDGYAPSSQVAKFKELFDGAGASTHVLVQFPQDGIHGDAIQITRALSGAPEQIRRDAWVYAVPKMKAPSKAEILGISRAELFRRWDRMFWYIAGRVSHGTTNETQ